MLKHIVCNSELYKNEAPQTGVMKYDWISLWIITPQDARDSQQLLQIENTYYDFSSGENR